MMDGLPQIMEKITLQDTSASSAPCPICHKVYNSHKDKRVNDDNLKNHMKSKKAHSSIISTREGKKTDVQFKKPINISKQDQNNAVKSASSVTSAKVNINHKDKSVNEDNLKQHLKSKKVHNENISTTEDKKTSILETKFLKSLQNFSNKKEKKISGNQQQLNSPTVFSRKTEVRKHVQKVRIIASVCPICGKVYSGHESKKVNDKNLSWHMKSHKGKNKRVDKKAAAEEPKDSVKSAIGNTALLKNNEKMILLESVIEEVHGDSIQDMLINLVKKIETSQEEKKQMAEVCGILHQIFALADPQAEVKPYGSFARYFMHE